MILTGTHDVSTVLVYLGMCLFWPAYSNRKTTTTISLNRMSDLNSLRILARVPGYDLYDTVK